jgi:hypothetical protein
MGDSVMRREREHRKTAAEHPDAGYDASDHRVGGSFARELATPHAGGPIPSPARKVLETGLGHSFANVRVHADARADRLARSIQARAFTVGDQIYFQEDAYRPTTRSGMRLLAHEAAHVAQQQCPASRLGVDEILEIDAPDSNIERNASDAADSVLAGETATVASEPLGSSAPVVHRWLDVFPGSDGDEDHKGYADKTQGGIGIFGSILDTVSAFLPEENSYLGIANLAADVAGNTYESVAGGQDLGESFASTLGQTGAGVFLEDFIKTPEDMAINAIHSGATLLGLDENVTDVTGVASDITPTSFVGDLAGNASRGIVNLLTGDVEAQERHAKDLKEGDGGAPLQGYALASDFIDRLLDGEDAEAALMQVGSQGEDSPLARIGNYLGDTAFAFGQDIDEAQELADGENGVGVMEFLGIGEDENTTTFLDHVGSDLSDLLD